MNNTRNKTNLLLYIFSAIIGVLSILFFKNVQCAVRYSLYLCAQNVVPSLLVFSCVSAILVSSPYSDNLFTKKFSQILGLGANSGTWAFFSLISGFPTGALGAKELLEQGRISQKDAENLVCLGGNAGLVFVLGCVGGAFSDMKFALTVFGCQTVASVTLFRIMAAKNDKNDIFVQNPSRTEYFAPIDLPKAVTNTSVAMVKICTFVCFFGVVCTFVSDIVLKICQNTAVDAFIISFIEVSSAVGRCARLGEVGKYLCAFAVGFSGLSAILQSISACPAVSLGKYFASRLAMGALCTAYFVFISRALNFFA